MASPLHDLLPEEGVFAILLQFVVLKDVGQVVSHGAMLLVRQLLQLVVRLHLLHQSLQQLGVLLREVRLLLGPLLILHVDGANLGHLGHHGHSWLGEHARPLERLLHHLFYLSSLSTL